MSQYAKSLTAAAIARSLAVYYRDTARTARMDRLNSQFVRKGSLAFDIGAHVGDRTASFLRLGARVVALEPQPRIFRALRLIHGRNPRAVLRPEGIGAAAAEVEMFVNTENPTTSTTSRAFVDAAPEAVGWQGQNWDQTIRVPVTTLDCLIARHGLPDFVKLDVEGFEAEALSGLTTPLPALSFEFTTLQRDVAFSCLDRLSALSGYRFNYSLGEEHRLLHDPWIDAATMQAEIAALPDAANSGDIFARHI